MTHVPHFGVLARDVLTSYDGLILLSQKVTGGLTLPCRDARLTA
jgi:hypothetical protein